jgi:hypothetical protein
VLLGDKNIIITRSEDLIKIPSNSESANTYFFLTGRPSGPTAAGIFAATRVGMELGSFLLRDGRAVLISTSPTGALALPVVIVEGVPGSEARELFIPTVISLIKQAIQLIGNSVEKGFD